MVYLSDDSETPKVSLKRLKQFRVFLLSHLAFSLIYELLANYLCVTLYQKDIQSYEKDDIWKREFFKATRNLFVFTTILTFLVICVGAIGVYKKNRILTAIFIVMIIMEWGFELIGVFTSQDWKIFIYKVICQLTRPSLFLSTAIFWWLMEDLTI